VDPDPDPDPQHWNFFKTTYYTDSESSDLCGSETPSRTDTYYR
jgi:hypothetical protein